MSFFPRHGCIVLISFHIRNIFVYILENLLPSVDQFLQLLLDVRALPEGEEYQDDRVIATLRLMNYIRRIGRDEIYIKYVHQLVNVCPKPICYHVLLTNYPDASSKSQLCRSGAYAEASF